MHSQIRQLARRLPSPLKSFVTVLYTGLGSWPFQVARPYFVVARIWRRRVLGLWAEAKRPVMLFIGPEAGLTPYFAIHAILAKSASTAGHAAIVLSCDGILPICSWKIAAGVKPTAPNDRENRACRSCRKDALLLGQKFGLVDVSVESLLGGEDREMISAILEENSTAPWKTNYDGIAFGDAALGHALRDCCKLDVSELSAEDHALLKALLFSALAIYFAVKTLAARYAVKRIAFYGTYAYWIPVLLFARKHRIPVTQFEHGYNLDVDRRLIVMRERTAHEEVAAQIDRWPEYRDNAIEPAAVAKIAESSLFRLRGHGGASTHSPNWVQCDKPIQAALGLSPDRKTIVAYSSSADEFVGGYYSLKSLGKSYPQTPKPFEDNTTWLRALIDWVGGRTDLQLIVRLHPRLATNRGRPVATEYLRLKHEFAKTAPNAVVIWPEDQVSSYNLAEIADAVVVSWSTMGLELARFGVPVVAAFEGIGSFPTGGFIAFEDNQHRYFQAVEAALSHPASISAITEAFRWTYFAFLSPSVDVSDLVPTYDYGGTPRWRTPKNHQTIMSALADNADLSALNMARLPQGGATKALERKAIMDAIERFVLYLVTGKDGSASRPKILEPQGDRSVVIDLDGKIFRRYSPMAHRLVAMLRQQAALDRMTQVA
jgi:hypothetical protein